MRFLSELDSNFPINIWAVFGLNGEELSHQSDFSPLDGYEHDLLNNFDHYLELEEVVREIFGHVQTATLH